MSAFPRRALPATIALAFLVAWSLTARADQAPPRLDHAAVPTAEAVDLTCDPDKPDYTGTVKVTLAVKQPTDVLRFHARGLTIDHATLAGASGTLAPTAIEPLDPDQKRLRFAAPLTAGNYTLTMTFHNGYNTHAISFYKVVTGGHAYLFTQFEDTEAREAFPCWDEPEFKIPWQMTLHVPAADLAVSNTPVASEKTAGTTKTVVFEPTRPLPSYLIAMAVGPFETVPITGMSVPGRVVVVQGASAMAVDAARAAGPLLKSLERYFGRPYPYAKLDLIAAPEFLFGAMENAGAIVFADRALLLDSSIASAEQLNRVHAVMAHEMAHMWFGDLVTMKWWDDIWLNESFATWMAKKAMDDVYPRDHQGMGELFGIQRAFTIDSRPSTRAMRSKVVGQTSLGETASELTYNKGGAVLTMFEGWVGPETFRAGVLDYLKAHEWANAEGHDLWLAIGKRSGEDIDGAMASFLDQAGVPLVTVAAAGGGKVRLSQARFLTVGDAGATPERWRVPVILRYPSGNAQRTLRVWLANADTVVDLGTKTMPAWIMPNAGASGYYRWQVPDGMRDALIAARGSLSARERIDMISNFTAQLRAGGEHGERYLKMVEAMAGDPEPEVLRADMESLDETRIPLATPHSSAQLASWVRSTFEPAFRRLGRAPQPDELPGVSISRGLLMHLLADAGRSTPMLAYAESLSRSYRNAPASVPPSLVEPSIVLAAHRGNAAMFEDYRHRFETAVSPSDRALYLAGLGSFRDPAIRATALEYSLKGPLRPQETSVIAACMSENGLTASNGRGGGGGSVYPDEIMKWTLSHWDDLAAKMPPNFASRNLRMTSGCAGEREAELKAFFSDPKRDAPGIQASLRRMGDAMDECSKLHDREAARVERWLNTVVVAP
jgi:cytosol alanyl aminopeptidase